MPLTKEKKQSIFNDFGASPRDTGSAEVQVALLTARIEELADHFKAHKKDINSRRGLLKLIGQRRKLLKYLKKNQLEKYRALLKRLNLRK